VAVVMQAEHLWEESAYQKAVLQESGFVGQVTAAPLGMREE